MIFIFNNCSAMKILVSSQDDRQFLVVHSGLTMLHEVCNTRTL